MLIPVPQSRCGVHSSDLPLSPGGPIHSAALLPCADDEAMATDVAPPASAELTELGKCLMKQEVRARFHCHHPSCALFVTHLCGADSLLQHSRCRELQRAVLIVAEATKHSGLGIQCNIQLQCVSSSVGEAEGIQPRQHFLALPPSLGLLALDGTIAAPCGAC